MPAAMTPLATHTVSGSSTTSVTFSSISGVYRDLVLVIDGNASADVNMLLRFNGDTGSNYDVTIARASGSSTSGGTVNSTGINFNGVARIGTTASTFTVNIMDYATTDKYKALMYQAARATNGVELGTGRWFNTAAITSVTCLIVSGNYTAGTTFSLYGVSAQ